MVLCCQSLTAQNLIHRVDSFLSARYYREGVFDTTYITRPKTRWTLITRLNFSGMDIESKGYDQGRRFKSVMQANRKTTISLGASYLGVALSLSLNPAQLAGKYHDFEINFKSYGRRFGFDVSYTDAKNFEGWYDADGLPRYTLPDGTLAVKTLNANAFYIFNHRRFSYPAAFSHNYIQRRSAGSFLLAASFQWQHAFHDWDLDTKLRMTNIGLGAGYGYNFVPHRGWLLHLSALPTFILYSHTSMTFGEDRIPLHYHFPEVIITSRGAVVRQWTKTYAGISMRFNFTNIGSEKSLAVHNQKWLARAFYGIRLGK
jgi:hypothetical protein